MMTKIRTLVLGAALFALCASVEAQQSGKVPKVGLLFLQSHAENVDLYSAFLQGLHQLGYIERKNILIEARWADQNLERLRELADELVRLNVDVIVAGAPQPTLAAKKATTTIPIVFLLVNDPVELGLVSSLARPGGTVTGLTSAPGSEINGKRLEILRETLPKVSRVAILWNPENPASVVNMEATETSARSLGFKLESVEMRHVADLKQAFTAMKREGAEALIPINSPVVTSQIDRIADLAASNRLPTMCAESRWSEGGALMSYGTNYSDLYRRAATYVDKILKGVKPADLPVEQPTKFELAINLKTAKQIGLTIPPNVLARADRVIR